VVSEKTTDNFGVMILIFFIVGIFLMFIDEGVGIIFGVGLLLFLISFIAIIFVITWNVAVSAEKISMRFLGGNDEQH